MAAVAFVIDEASRQPDGKYACPHCSRPFFKKNLILHIFRAHTANGRKVTRRGSRNRKYKYVHSGWYKGQWCDSGWELAFLIYHHDQGVKVVRNEQGFRYVYRRKNYWYYPDFIIDGDIYVEVKGIVNARVRAKSAAFPHMLHIYDAKAMKPILKYVVANYGKDYVRLLKQSRDESLS